MAALGADVGTHVLHDPEDGNTDFLEHLESLAGVDERDVLRRGDNHRSGDRDFLGEGELDVSGSGRHVDDEVIDVLPAGVLEELFEGLGHHRPAPDHRGIDVDEKADRDRLDAVAHHRLERLAVSGLGPTGDAEHHRLRGSIDIGIEHPDARSFRRERESQIHGCRRFSHPALAGGDRDDVLHPGNQLDPALHRVGNDLARDTDVHGAHAWDAAELACDEFADRIELGLGGIAELDFERDAAAFQFDVSRRLGRNEILARIRVNDFLERSVNLFLGD